MKHDLPQGGERYWNPTVAGLLLGLLLFGAFILTGHGLGASGGLHRLILMAQGLFQPDHILQNPYTAPMAASNTFDHWLVLQVIGVLIGGALSGVLHGRMRVETRRGPLLGKKQRWLFAFAGGVLMGFGARFARGCTSGLALSGGAMLSVGAWIFMFSVFIAAYTLARPLGRLWTQE